MPQRARGGLHLNLGSPPAAPVLSFRAGRGESAQVVTHGCYSGIWGRGWWTCWRRSFSGLTIYGNGAAGWQPRNVFPRVRSTDGKAISVVGQGIPTMWSRPRGGGVGGWRWRAALPAARGGISLVRGRRGPCLVAEGGWRPRLRWVVCFFGGRLFYPRLCASQEADARVSGPSNIPHSSLIPTPRPI